MGVFFWLLLSFCVIALVVLFFPVKLRIEFEAGERGGRAFFYCFGKMFWKYEKKWGAKSAEDDSEFADDALDGDADDATPTFVATAPVRKSEPVAAKPAPVASKPASASPAEIPKEKSVQSQSTSKPAETTSPDSKSAQSDGTLAKRVDSAIANPDPAASKPAPVASKPAPANPDPSASPAEEKPASTAKKKEKRKLTDREFWTILLTPDMDERAFRYVRILLVDLVKLFRIRFCGCFVEGVRADYCTMGYGAALNGVMKSFPFLEAWDLRMDWCRDTALRAGGKIHSRLNLCRVLGYVVEFALYAGILLFLFWRRRARVFRTNELPELGYVRSKILGWIVED